MPAAGPSDGVPTGAVLGALRAPFAAVGPCVGTAAEGLLAKSPGANAPEGPLEGPLAKIDGPGAAAGVPAREFFQPSDR